MLDILEAENVYRHLPSTAQICNDWLLARMEAYENTILFEDVGRVIQEIDNRFNDFLDWARFYEEER